MFRFAHRRSGDVIRLRSRDRMSRRRVRFADAVKDRPGALFLRFLWRTFSRHTQPPLTLFWNGVDASATPKDVSNKTSVSKRICLALARGQWKRRRSKQTTALGGRAESEPYSLVNYFRGGLSFTATRRLREDSQCVRGFCAAALLKFVHPVGHRIDHIARRFTCRVLSLGCGRSDDLLFTLFDYANCFLLRHCCFFELPVWNLSYRTNFASLSSQINS